VSFSLGFIPKKLQHT